MSADQAESQRARLAKELGYQFQDPALLQQALTHRSHNAEHNERLEFLGDAVLNLVIAEALYGKFPEAKEGQLSRLRAHLVKGKTLAMLARHFQFGEALLLGQGELKAGGHDRKSILEGAFEAVVGAIFLDSDFTTCQRLLLDWYAPYLKTLTIQTHMRDAKSQLQEWLQGQGYALPQYDVLKTTGAEHCQTFHVVCIVKELDQQTTATGSTRKAAEQAAAEAMLAQLQPEAGEGCD